MNSSGLPVVILNAPELTKPCIFLLDSGSKKSLICKWLLLQSVVTKPSKIKVKSLSNLPLEIFGETNLNLRYHETSLGLAEVLVSDLTPFPFDGIIGLDLFEEWQAILHFPNQVLFTPQACIPFKTSRKVVNSYAVEEVCEASNIDSVEKEAPPCQAKVFLAKAYQLPAHSHGQFLVRLASGQRGVRPKLAQQDWVLPATYFKSKGLITGGTLFCLDKEGYGVIPWINLQEKPITVHEDFFLGYAEKFDAYNSCKVSGSLVDPEGKKPVLSAATVSGGVSASSSLGDDDVEDELKKKKRDDEDFEELVHSMIEKSDCPDELKDQLKEKLYRYKDILAKSGDPIGFCPLYEPTIPLTTDKPVYKPPFQIPHRMRSEMDKIIDDFMKGGIIEHSRSPYNSPAFLVPKKDGGYRLVVDYRNLNQYVINDPHPLPRINQILECLGTAKFFTAIDLYIGFHNVKIAPEDREKTAFSTHNGHFQYVSLPMGLKNAPAVFQRLMNLLLSGYLSNFSFIYVDDIVVYSPDAETHLNHLEMIFARLKETGFKVKLSKCQLFRTHINYLGYVVSTRGLMIDPIKTDAVENFPTPTNVKDLQAFLGLVNYFRVFIQHFAKTAQPLYRLLKKGVKFEWSLQQSLAFSSLKKALCTAPVLRFPDFSKKFILTTDASAHALGAILTQVFEDGEHPVAFASRSLKGAECNYPNTDRELLAVVYGIETFRSYLWGYEFTVRTDHSAVVYLARNMSDNPRSIRWYLRLSEYNFTVEHRKGKNIPHADALSRNPVPPPLCDENAEEICAYISPSLQETSFVPLWDLNEWKKEIAHSKKPDNYDVVERNGLWYVHDALWVPQNLRSAVLHAFHDPPVQGHQGTDKMLNAMKSEVFWPNMANDVRHFLRSCETCQKHKQAYRKRPIQPYTIPAKPFQTVSIDVIGPVPVSRSGFQYILAVQDMLSRWVQFTAMRDATADTTARTFLARWVCMFGVPENIVTDRGTNFVSSTFRNFLDFLGTKARNTTAYRPESNGANERTHRDLHSYLAMFLNPSKRETWDTLLAAASWVHNSSYHLTLKMSPFEVLYGMKPNVAKAWLPSPLDDHSQCAAHVQKYYGVSPKYLQEVRTRARASIEQAQQKLMERINVNIRPVSWKPGDLVLIRSHDQRTYVSRKWSPKFRGPYVVISVMSSVVLLVEHCYTKKRDLVHTVFVKPYHPRSPAPSPHPSDDDDADGPIPASQEPSPPDVVHIELSTQPDPNPPATQHPFPDAPPRSVPARLRDSVRRFVRRSPRLQNPLNQHYYGH